MGEQSGEVLVPILLLFVVTYCWSLLETRYWLNWTLGLSMYDFCCWWFLFVLFFCAKKKSCSIYSGYRDKLEKKDQDSWKFTVVVLCFLPNLMIMLESGLSVCHHFSWLYCVHWSPTSHFRSTMEGTSLPPAFYLDISIDSYLQTDFLPFFSLAYWNCWFFCSLW